MGINVPEYSRLDNPHQVEGLPKESKQSFYELAYSRTRYCTEEEHLKFESEVCGDDWQFSTAMYIVEKNDRTTTNQDEETFVNTLDISINKDYFKFKNEDYSDLIPYAVEHEIYELWLYVKRGYRVQNSQSRHLLARRRQFEMAMRDGNAERLLEFYKKKNNSMGDEFEYAYNKAKQRVKKTNENSWNLAKARHNQSKSAIDNANKFENVFYI